MLDTFRVLDEDFDEVVRLKGSMDATPPRPGDAKIFKWWYMPNVDQDETELIPLEFNSANFLEYVGLTKEAADLIYDHWQEQGRKAMPCQGGICICAGQCDDKCAGPYTLIRVAFKWLTRLSWTYGESCQILKDTAADQSFRLMGPMGGVLAVGWVGGVARIATKHLESINKGLSARSALWLGDACVESPAETSPRN
jgi:hypothetical protein